MLQKDRIYKIKQDTTKLKETNMTVCREKGREKDKGRKWKVKQKPKPWQLYVVIWNGPFYVMNMIKNNDLIQFEII